MPEHLRNAAFEAAVLPEKYTTPDHYDMTTRKGAVSFYTQVRPQKHGETAEYEVEFPPAVVITPLETAYGFDGSAELPKRHKPGRPRKRRRLMLKKQAQETTVADRISLDILYPEYPDASNLKVRTRVFCNEPMPPGAEVQPYKNHPPPNSKDMREWIFELTGKQNLTWTRFRRKWLEIEERLVEHKMLIARTWELRQEINDMNREGENLCVYCGEQPAVIVGNKVRCSCYRKWLPFGPHRPRYTLYPQIGSSWR